MMKLIVLVFLITILYCLGSAAFFLIRKNGQSSNMAKALTWRIGLSILLFILLLIGYVMGWIQPHPIQPNYNIPNF